MQEIQVLCHSGECMRSLKTKACYMTPHWQPSYVISIWILYLNEVQIYVRSNSSHINLHIIPKWSTNLHEIQLEHSGKLLEHVRCCVPPNYPQLWTLNTKSLLLSQPALQKMKPLEVLALSIKLSALKKQTAGSIFFGNQKCLNDYINLEDVFKDSSKKEHGLHSVAKKYMKKARKGNSKCKVWSLFWIPQD